MTPDSTFAPLIAEQDSDAELIVEIERILPGGYGLAHADGKTILVPFSAPGDILRVDAEKSTSRARFYNIQEIITPSHDRVAPPCQYYGICGGCDFQHLDYNAQIKAKSEILRDSMRHIAGMSEKELDLRGISIRIFPAPNPFGYRTRARWQHDTENWSVGYYRRRSNEVCDIDECPILSQNLQRELTKLRLKIGRKDKQSSLSDIRSYKAMAFGDPSGDASESIVTIANEQYSFNDDCFFQSSIDLLPEMIAEVIGNGEGQTAFDLYCGVGLFTLPLARRYKRVVGVEGSQTACSYARFNATNAGLNNVQIHTQKVERWLSSHRSSRAANSAVKKFRAPDLVILDPPRLGAGSGVIEWLVNSKARQIVYVSCDPATLARDLKPLLTMYKIDSIAIFDLFPQTHHVETVVRLSYLGHDHNPQRPRKY